MTTSRLTALFIVLLALVSLAGCSRVEDKVFAGFMAVERTLAGLDTATVTVDDIDWVYLKNDWRADRETLVLVHGYTGDKYNWTRLVAKLGDGYNILVPDLPGHGESTRSMDIAYDMDTQARRLLSLMTALGIEKFHLGGNSMGGAIAVRAAWLAPGRVMSLGLFDPGGAHKVESEFDAALNKGINPLVIRKPEDFAVVMAWAMKDPPFIPWPVPQVMARQGVERAALHEKIFKDLVRDDGHDQTRILPEIVARTLVIWGDKDRLLNVANADVFVDTMPQARKVIMPGIGHVPMLEAPGESAQIYKDFLAGK